MNARDITTSSEPSCLICHSPQYDPYLVVPNRFHPEEAFSLVQCSQCGFIFLNPRPDEKEMTNYYEEEDYQPHQQDPKNVSEYIYQKVRYWNSRYKRRMIESLTTRRTILDYGCGTGEFLLEMQQGGWRTYGYEPAEKARHIAIQYGLTLLESLDQLSSPVDVITLWHVLEHIHEPISLLKHLKKILTAEGLLVIAVPNPLSIDSRLFRKNWVAYDAPRHLYHFRPSDLESLLQPLGFRIVAYRGLYFDPWYNALLSAQLESRHKSLTKKVFIMVKGFLAAILAFGQGILFKKKNSSVIYVIKSEDLQ